MRKSTLIAAATAVALSASAANAVTTTFDFVGLSDSFRVANGYEAIWDQSVRWHQPGTVDSFWHGDGDGTIEVMAFVEAADGSKYKRGYAHAFLDASNNPNTQSGPAGLGLCSVGTDGALGNAAERSLCSSNLSGISDVDTSDDNVATPEILGLMFNKKVMLSLGTITNAGHNLANGSIEISIDDSVSFQSYQVIQGIIQGGQGLKGTSFFLRPDAEEGYLASVVASQIPVPAAGLLLVSALGGMMGFRKIKKS